MITREQVADLRPGDVVEYSGHRDLRGAKLVGPVRERRGLFVADYLIRNVDGSPPSGPWGDLSLTVISRAPRPLYVNHDRTHSHASDVVRDAYGVVWLVDSWKTWHSADSTCELEHQDTGLTQPLTLLVDGETGQVVP